MPRKHAWFWNRVPEWYKCLDRSFFAAWNLLITHGHLKSSCKHESVDRRGFPIPWYSYPAIAYLETLSVGGKSVLEFGSGNSTLWWSERCHCITAIETDPRWFVRLIDNPRITPLHVHDSDRYANFARMKLKGKKFDIVVIDGPIHTRLSIAETISTFVTAKGFVLLDDSSWFPDTVKALEKQGYTRIDFVGLSPIVSYTKSTTVFVKGRPHATYPSFTPSLVGGVQELWDHTLAPGSNQHY